ncbi:MAG TPA: PspA/IM30 family protein [Thermoanaerobaculia bacterium]|nr:PspA/IM30 family protein [Thermoanaerobaculia bacterium]
MLGRVTRLLKSWLGYFISLAEDPEVMLQQAVEEMRSTLPRLNQILVSTRATVLKLESDVRRLESQEHRLVQSIQHALREGSADSRSIAEDEAGTLEQVREDLATTREEIEAAAHAHENALVSIEEMKRRLRERIQLAQRAVEEHRRAKVVGEAAAALIQLDANDTGATTEKYLDQVRQKSAEAKAAMEMAVGSSDLKKIQAERNVRKARAQSLLREMEQEMGLPERKAITGESEE